MDVSAVEIAVNELPTKSVTLTPYRATIVREIRTTIQPGPNEITLFALDPNINPDSIRIEGTGAATITDIQTSTVPRRGYEVDDDISSDSNSISESDDDDSDYENETENEEVKTLRAEIKTVETRLAQSHNRKIRTQTQLEFLDGYGRKLNPEVADSGEVSAFLKMYAMQRGVDGEVHHAAVVQEGEDEEVLGRLKGRLERVEKRVKRERERRMKGVKRERMERARVREREREGRRRRREEARSFYTEMMGQVVVHVDSLGSSSSFLSSAHASDSALTPSSSPMDQDMVREEKKENDILLRLTYVLPKASWTPRYELSISTPSATAAMVYRAEYYNLSSETWRDAQLTLSTSEAAWSRLDEAVPSLSPWHIRLDDSVQRGPQPPGTWMSILGEKEEQLAHKGPFAKPRTGGLFGQPPVQQVHMMARAPPQAQRGFGSTVPQNQSGQSAFGQSSTTGGFFGSQSQPQAQQQTSLFGGSAQPSNATSLFGGPARSAPSAFGNTASTPAQPGNLFGRSVNAAPQPPAPVPAPEQASAPAPAQEETNTNITNQPTNLTVETFDEEEPPIEATSDTDSEPSPLPLSHRPSTKQDYGLTTTYALPGKRNITPSHHGRRHVLAELSLSQITLSYMIVPKKRAAAFFRARITNTSALKILPGRLGLTVDGTFLGTTTMNKPCGAGDDFQVSLGVDPAIQVSYAKPMVRRLTGGFFAKEDAALFRRSCWVKNTKGIAVTVVVCDQVPVSQEEGLKVKIVEPKGLESYTEGKTVELEEGKGEVAVLKDGEVRWTVELGPGKEVRVVLEYETRAPLGSEVVS